MWLEDSSCRSADQARRCGRRLDPVVSHVVSGGLTRLSVSSRSRDPHSRNAGPLTSFGRSPLARPRLWRRLVGLAATRMSLAQ